MAKVYVVYKKEYDWSSREWKQKNVVAFKSEGNAIVYCDTKNRDDKEYFFDEIELRSIVR